MVRVVGASTMKKIYEVSEVYGELVRGRYAAPGSRLPEAVVLEAGSRFVKMLRGGGQTPDEGNPPAGDQQQPTVGPAPPSPEGGPAPWPPVEQPQESISAVPPPLDVLNDNYPQYFSPDDIPDTPSHIMKWGLSSEWREAQFLLLGEQQRARDVGGHLSVLGFGGIPSPMEESPGARNI